jgi:ABC-2 type transport system permease protein
MNLRRLAEVARKDFAELSVNKSALFGLVFLPAVLTLSGVASTFMAIQAIEVGRIAPDAAVSAMFLTLLLMLFIPTTTTTVVGSMALVLEKTNRSLEPLLATPITDRELFWGKAVPPLVLGLGETYLAFAVVFLTGDFLLMSAHLPLEFPGALGLFTMLVLGTLLGLLGTFSSLLISSRSKDLRTAQQLSFLVATPVFAAVIVSFIIVPPSFATYLLATGVLLLLDLLLIRTVTDRFQRANILVGGE